GGSMKDLKEGDMDFLRIEQMVIIRTSSLNAADYCLGHNVDLGLEAGLSDKQVAAVQGDYEASDVLTAREKLAIRWAEAVTELRARAAAGRCAAMRAGL